MSIRNISYECVCDNSPCSCYLEQLEKNSALNVEVEKIKEEIYNISKEETGVPATSLEKYLGKLYKVNFKNE